MKVGYPSLTETAMTQHAFLAAELALQAQSMAKRVE